MEKTYYVTIVDTSYENMTKKQEVQLKDTQDAVSIDSLVTPSEPLVIEPEAWATLYIHNEKAKGDTDYTQLIIIDKEGAKFSTGSEAFKEAFLDIFSDMHGTDEEWSVKCYKKPAKNYPGSYMLMASIV